MHRATTEILAAAHRALATVLDTAAPGALALDATVGNGWDTAYLAKRVGPGGLVVGFDVQVDAVARTNASLEAAGFAGRAHVLHAGHETLAEALPPVLTARGFAADAYIAAACFNLGYLPRSDKRVVTEPATTLAALAATIERLAPSGVLTVAMYPGHGGGAAERDAVLAWAEALPRSEWNAQHTRFTNRPAASELLVVERR